MAEHAVASAMGKLGVLLGQALIQDATFLSGVRDDVEWLRSELRWMDCFLKDAAAKGRGDERMKNWTREVRDVAYQAEDVVDIFRWRIERRRGVISEFFRRYAFIPSDFIALYDIGNEILQIKSRMENIRKSREEYGILNLGENRAELSGDSVDDRIQARRQRSPRLHDEPFVVGFDVHRKFILEHLLDANVKRSCVISVVGMGGLGKTTLAAKVYNSKEVKSHFTSCAWIIVSQEYRVNELRKNIIKQVMGSILTKEDLKKLEKMTLDELMMKVDQCPSLPISLQRT